MERNLVYSLKKHLYPNNCAKKLVFDSLVALSGTVVARTIGLIGSILLARLIGPKYLGEFAIVQNTIATTALFAGLGLGLLSTKNVAKHRDTNPSYVKNYVSKSIKSVTALAAVLSVLWYIAANKVSINLIGDESLCNHVKISAFCLLFVTVNGVQLGVLAGFERYKRIAVINITNSILTAVICYILALKLNSVGCVLGYCLVSLFSFLQSSYYINIEIKGLSSKSDNKIDHRSISVVLECLPVLLTMAMVAPAMWIGNVILAKTNSGVQELGNLNIAVQWRTIILFIPSVIVQPLLASVAKTKNETEIFQLLWRSILVCVSICSLVAIGIYIFRDNLGEVYGSKYSELGVLIKYGSISAVFASISVPCIQVYIAINKAWTNFIIHFVWGCVFLGYLGLQMEINALEASKAYVIAYILQAMCYIVAVYNFRLSMNKSIDSDNC